MLWLLLHLTPTMTFVRDYSSYDDNVVDLVDVSEDDSKPDAKIGEHDNNGVINYDNDFEVGGEEDELDEDYDDVNEAIFKFLFDDNNFYVDKEGDMLVVWITLWLLVDLKNLTA